MADNKGFGYFRRGQPTPFVGGTSATTGIDYFRRGRPFPAVQTVAAGGTTVSPPVATATGSGLVPTVVVSPAAPVATATGAGIAPTVLVSPAVPVATATGSALAPTVAVVQPVPVATATGAAPVPTVATGAVVVAVPVAGATGAGLAPAVVVSPAFATWAANHEEGSLADWYFPSTFADGGEGGGEFNNDGATTAASADVAHGGRFAAKLTVPAVPVSGGSGARLFRWVEPRANREAYYEAWYWFPDAYDLSDIPGDGYEFWNIQQFKSRNQAETLNDPFWIVEGINPSPGVIRMRLVWWGNMSPAEGPHQGESGFRAYTQSTADFPIDQWVNIRVWLRQSSAGNFDGAIKVWQDDVLLFDLSSVRTGYDNTTYSAWGTETSWAITNYSNGLVPGPSPIYVDDVRIWVGTNVAAAAPAPAPRLTQSVPVATATGAAIAPTVTYSPYVVAVPVAAAGGAALAPAVAVTQGVPAATATGAATAPTVAVAQPVPAATATGDAPTPAVNTGGVVVAVPVATATGAGLAPTVGVSPAFAVWAANHEEGSLADWYFPSTFADGGEGGGEFNNGGATTEASADVARGGRFAAKLTVPATPVAGGSGARLFRWVEPRAHREAYYDSWYYFPDAYDLSDIPGDGFEFWNLQQFKSRNQAETLNDPFWIVEGYNPSPGVIRLRLVWWGNMIPAEGPHAGESGFRAYTQAITDLPIDTWVNIRVWLRQSSASTFDGAIKVWQDGTLLFDQSNVRTGYDNTTYSSWHTETSWAITNYSNGLVPGPAPIYVDDARIWVGTDARGAAIAPAPRVSPAVPVAAATGAALAPTVTYSPYLIAVPVATATGAALAPTVAVVQPAPVATAAVDAVAPAPLVAQPVPVATASGDGLAPAPLVAQPAPVAAAAGDAFAPAPLVAVPVPVATATGDGVAPAVDAPYTVPVPVATAAVDALTPTVAVAVPVPAATAAGAAVAPTVAIVQPVPVATATADGVAPSVTYSPYLIDVPVATATGEAPAPSLQAGGLIGPPQATATGAAPTPTVALTQGVPVAAADATAPAPAVLVTIPAPTATAQGDAAAPLPVLTIGVPVATATGAALAPGVVLTIPAPLAVASGIAVAPTTALVILPPVATGTGAGLAPAVDAPYTVLVPVATATGAALAPAVSSATPIPGVTVLAPPRIGAVVAGPRATAVLTGTRTTAVVVKSGVRDG